MHKVRGEREEPLKYKLSLLKERLVKRLRERESDSLIRYALQGVREECERE